MFQVGHHAATFVRTGHFSFAVYPRGFHGSHVLELVDLYEPESFTAYLDGVEFSTEGCQGLWDLCTELSVGESRFLEDEDV